MYIVYITQLFVTLACILFFTHTPSQIYILIVSIACILFDIYIRLSQIFQRQISIDVCYLVYIQKYALDHIYHYDGEGPHDTELKVGPNSSNSYCFNCVGTNLDVLTLCHNFKSRL